jgi:hypothetical protein
MQSHLSRQKSTTKDEIDAPGDSTPCPVSDNFVDGVQFGHFTLFARRFDRAFFSRGETRDGVGMTRAEVRGAGWRAGVGNWTRGWNHRSGYDEA